MSHGFEVYNGNNQVSISENFKNFHLVRSGVLTTPWDYPLHAVADDEILFIRKNTSSITWELNLYPVQIGYMDWRFKYYEDIEYVVVKATTLAPTAGHGLQIYSSDGSIAFDSNRRTLTPLLASSYFAGVNYPNQPFAREVTLALPNNPLAGKKTYISANAVRGYAEFFEDINWDSTRCGVFAPGENPQMFSSTVNSFGIGLSTGALSTFNDQYFLDEFVTFMFAEI